MNSQAIFHYSAPPLLGNAHLQNILSSTGLRRLKLKLAHSGFIKNHEEIILETPHKVRLMAKLNRRTEPAKSMIILIHGWEGNSESAYLLSMAAKLFAAGHDTLRLHLRDHGSTTHLNEDIFNSSMIDEVVDAISSFQQTYTYDHYSLAGFSLGGNFVLRAGLRNPELTRPLSKIMSVCPVLDPAKAMLAMDNTFSFYDRYFVYKWKKSLAAKAGYFPTYKYLEALKKMRTLNEMNHYFIPRYTGFKTLENYFESYTITGNRLNSLDVPTLIIASQDDPIIPVRDYENVKTNHNTQLEITAKGGHCAYLSTWTLNSWLDDRARVFFEKDWES